MIPLLGSKYIEQVRAHLDRIESEQLPRIREAADLIAQRLAAGGALHIHDSGHMLNHELVHRAGGLFAMVPFQYSFTVNDPVSPVHTGRPGAPDDVARTFSQVELALEAGNIRPGDVLIVGSVSGRAVNVVHVALRARERGVLVVALTSVAYSSSVASKHPSGKRLFEAADIWVDNGAVLGDACLEVEGLPVKAVPTSGVGAAITAWTLIAETIERLIAMGKPPHVFASANLDWGPEFNEKAKQEFDKVGL